jgi:hypothetical protein
MSDIVKIQSLFRGYIVRLKQLPLIMYKMQNYLKISPTPQGWLDGELGKCTETYGCTISIKGANYNIIEVLKQSKKMKIFSIGFLGSNGGAAKKLSNLNIIVPHQKVARIQECHIFLGHFILNRVEEMFFFNKKVSTNKSKNKES